LLRDATNLGRVSQGKGSIVTRPWKAWCLALSLLGSAAPAAALPLTLSLVPSSPNLGLGQSFSVSVVVGGLTELVGDNVQEIALESFSLSLQFDASRLQFQSLSFGGSLGDPNDAFETFLSGPGTPNSTGVVTLGEFSFLTESQLLALQSAPFTLATVGLRAVEGLGPTQLQLIGLDASSLGGVSGRALGNLLQAPSPLNVTVPEPAAATLVLLAFAGVVRRARR